MNVIFLLDRDIVHKFDPLFLHNSFCRLEVLNAWGNSGLEI